VIVNAQKMYREDVLSTVLLVLVLLYFFIGTPPYGVTQSTALSNEYSGDLLNQLIWLFLSALAIPLISGHWQSVKLIMSRSAPLVFLMLWCAASIIWATDFDVSARRVVRFFLVSTVAVAIIASPISAQKLLRCLVVVTGLVVAANFAFAALFPNLAFDVSGNLTGLYSHKNTAGIMATVITLIWISAARHEEIPLRRAVYLLGSIVGFFFVVLTGSATALTVLVFVTVFVIGTIFLARQYGGKLLFPASLFAVTAALSAMMLMSFKGIRIADLPERLLADPTITGRVELWGWMFVEIGDRPWLGHGFGSFWNTGAADSLQSFGPNWLQTIQQAHNGYLDALATIGILGLFFLGVYLFSAAISGIGLLRNHCSQDVRALVEGLWSITIASLVYNLTESSFLSSGSVVWFFLVFSYLVFRACATIQKPGQLSVLPSFESYAYSPRPQ